MQFSFKVRRAFTLVGLAICLVVIVLKMIARWSYITSSDGDFVPPADSTWGRLWIVLIAVALPTAALFWYDRKNYGKKNGDDIR